MHARACVYACVRARDHGGKCVDMLHLRAVMRAGMRAYERGRCEVEDLCNPQEARSQLRGCDDEREDEGVRERVQDLGFEV